MDSLQPLIETLRRHHLLTSRQLRDLDGVARECAAAEEFLQALEQREWLTAYQADHLRRGQGDRLAIGPYVLLGPLGGGGMGQVLRARHRLLERVAAIKRIRPDYQAHPQMAERFLREVRSAAALTHPNIVTVYDFYQDGDVFHLAMEIVPGADLRSHVERHGPLRVGLACDYAHQVCLGLQHAHGRGVVHRDIKPHNLIVTPDDLLKVIDFGLARRDSDPTITARGMMGTLGYMAPEQAVNAHEVDGRADIYSLGCTLYYLLAGHAPFADVPPAERLNADPTGQPPRIDRTRPDVPRAVIDVLRRMMEWRPRERFQRAAEAAEALGQLAAALRSEPRRVEISTPGAWLARPESEPDAKWRPVASTPATVVVRPGEAYHLLMRSEATESQLEGLARLRGLTALHTLSLTACARLTDDALAHVGTLPGLRRLHLSGCEQLTDDGLAHLQGLAALQFLDLSFCPHVTNTGLAHLRGLTALQDLDLGQCARLDKAGLAHLRGFTVLQSLNLSRCELVTDEVLECLKGLRDLRSLYLNRCRRITDAGLAHLHQLTALGVLSLTGCTQLTGGGLQRLERALPRCEVRVG